MKNFDVEKKLRKAADEIEVRDFSEVWEEIKDEIKVPVQVKKKRPRWIYALASVAACLIIFCAVGLPLLLRNQEIVYFNDELLTTEVDEQTFWTGLENSELNIVDLKRYQKDGALYLLKTDNEIVKGGKISFYNDASLYYVNLKFTDKQVKENSKEKYDEMYKNGKVTIQYKFLFEENGMWNYIAKANYNDVNYYMEITSDTEEITPFFDEFFNAN